LEFCQESVGYDPAEPGEFLLEVVGVVGVGEKRDPGDGGGE